MAIQDAIGVLVHVGVTAMTTVSLIPSPLFPQWVTRSCKHSPSTEVSPNVGVVTVHKWTGWNWSHGVP